MAIEIFDILRAKSPDETGQPESLKEHLKSCLNQVVIFHTMIENMVPSIELQLFRNRDQRKQFFKALAKAAILHDFGKIDYGFQRQVFTKEEKESLKDFKNIEEFFNDIKNVHFTRHEVLSAILASLLLGNKDDWNSKIITAILFHHYNRYYTDLKSFPEFILEDHLDQIIGYLDFIEKHENDFETSYLNLLDDFAREFHKHDFVVKAINELKHDADWDRITNAKKKLEEDEDDLSDFTWFYVPPNTIGQEISQFDRELLDFLLLLGALRRADYASSGKVAVEAERVSELLDFEALVAKIEQRIKEKDPEAPFWQSHYFENETPSKKMVLIAPTGSGKTEFSILWATKQKRKFLYTIPLRVALNDLYMRFKGTQGEAEFKEGYFDRESVNILHSASFIEYLKEEGSKYLDIERKVTSAKLLSFPIMLTTPDQILLTSLNYYGSDKIMAVYPISSIVIDEIQTYTPEMAAVVIRTLQLVNSLGGNILVMTATFPPYFEKYFNDMGFKLFDTTTWDLKGKIKNLDKKRHKIEVIEKNIFEYDGSAKNPEERWKINPDALDIIKKKKQEKDKILIVLNNVRKAIELYKELEGDNDEPIFLMHSRIVEKHKSERIEKAKEQLKNGEKVIFIATQVVEASVDLDFDFMITEISTIDSQIQRWGRVFRSREDEYNREEANILVFTGRKGEDGKVKFDRGTTAVYDRDVLEKTREVLLEYQEHYLSYLEEKEMVEKTFEKEINGQKLKEKFIAEIDENLKFLSYYTASKRSEAQRIFRNIAGITAVVPALMKEEAQGNEKWLKAFAEIIEGERKNKSGKEWTWEEIIEELRKEGFSQPELDAKWYLKAKMHEYSVSVPAHKKGLYPRLSHEFKGFWVLKVEKNEVDVLRKFGLDKLEEFKNIEEEIEFY